MPTSADLALVDTNVLVYALLPDAPHHIASRALLDRDDVLGANVGRRGLGVESHGWTGNIDGKVQSVRRLSTSGGRTSHPAARPSQCAANHLTLTACGSSG